MTPSLSLALLVVVVSLALLYLLTKVQKPYLYIPGETLSKILERCTWTTDSFYPVAWWKSGDYYTASVFGDTSIIEESLYDREILMAPNSATVCIDWFDHPEDMVKKYHTLIVLINHGLCNRASQNLVRGICKLSSKQKLGVCMINFQGVSGLAMTSSSIGIGLSFMVELKTVMERINQHVGASFPKVAVALSLGTIPLLEYIGLDKNVFSSSILVSSPLILDKFAQNLCFATKAMIQHGKEILKKNSDFVTKSDPERITKALDANSLEDFLSHTITKPWGYSALSSMFTSVDPLPRLDSLNKPTLMLYSLDDESIDFTSTVDLFRLCKNPNIAVAVTEFGGHCGFRSLGTENWLANVITEFASNSTRVII